MLSVLSQLGPGPAQQPQQDCTEQHIPVYTSQTEEFQLPCPFEAWTKAQGVCAHVQCLMATPPRGWLSPAEPQGIGMTQLQFWAPTKEVQGSRLSMGSVYFSQCLGQGSSHPAPSGAVLRWFSGEENMFVPRGRKCWVQPQSH